MANVKFKIEGMKELERSMKKLGKVPQKHVTASARKGMNIALKDSRANAPVDAGALKKGLKLTGERSRLKAKKVYQVAFNEKMNDIFQTKDVDGNINGYYPISQEYGFFAKNGRYIPGYRFIRPSLTNNAKKIEKTIVSEMKKKIDAEIASQGLR